ncbi:SAV_915 family protein [Streptomyces sp. NPDC006923]|uniref:SAV_915 family protein n=1 Tax=Streptomyces sp. NPDC006923 TaxID=3155355 RepID=UPI0033E02675
MKRLTSEDADEGSDPDPASTTAAGPRPEQAPEADSDADPDRPRAAKPLYVPVRTGSAGGWCLRLARTPLGARTAIGFTSAHRLTAVLGAQQRWIRLAEPALRALAAPLGATTVTVDPQLTAPAIGGRPAPDPVRARRDRGLSEAMPV